MHSKWLASPSAVSQHVPNLMYGENQDQGVSVMTLENHQSNKLELNFIVDQTRKLEEEKYFDYRLPYFNLVYGINFMIIPPKYTESLAS